MAWARRRRRIQCKYFMSLLLFALHVHLTCGDVFINAIFLLEISRFSMATYGSILTANFAPDSRSVHIASIQSDFITGAEARKTYFPDHTEIRLFQLLHITRVQASIDTTNNENTTNLVLQHLPSLCGKYMGTMAIESITTNPPLQMGATVDMFLQQFPPLVAPVAFAVWLITMLACSICWVLECCCRRLVKKKEEVEEIESQEEPAAPEEPVQPIYTGPQEPITLPSERITNTGPQEPITIPSERINPTLPVTATPYHRCSHHHPIITFDQPADQPSAPSIEQVLASMRLPFGLQEQCEDQYDQYEEWTPYLGPAAVRLESWPED